MDTKGGPCDSAKCVVVVVVVILIMLDTFMCCCLRSLIKFL
jgi:hypothetical protein